MSAVLELEVATRVYGRGNPRETCVVPFPRPRLRLSELIAQKVRAEVERVQKGRNSHTPPLSLRYLTDDDVSWAAGGAIASPTHTGPNADVEVDRALAAFRDGRFFVVVDGVRIDDLDAFVDLTPMTKIQFIRILPLVGGRC